jgi:ubiquitin-conjugating enzyme E2 J2
MYTPNGRFKTGQRLCLSNSDFHPESWNPVWGVSTILMGLYSFMLDSASTLGSISTTTAEKKRFAAESLAYNCQNAQFKALFPDLVELHELRLAEAQREAEEAAQRAANKKALLQKQQQQQSSSSSSSKGATAAAAAAAAPAATKGAASAAATGSKAVPATAATAAAAAGADANKAAVTPLEEAIGFGLLLAVVAAVLAVVWRIVG